MTIMEIDTLDMVRKIRDAQYEQIKGMSPEDRLKFYKDKAAAFERRISVFGQEGDLQTPSDAASSIGKDA